MNEYELRFLCPPQTPAQIRRQCDEWGGVVTGWTEQGSAWIDVYAKRTQTRKKGRILISTARPGQLTYRNLFSDSGSESFEYGLAWRREDHVLVAQALFSWLDKRDVLSAGGYQEPTDDAQTTITKIQAAMQTPDSQAALVKLSAAVGAYMESHLLLGAPVIPAAELQDEFATNMARTLVKQSSAWPEYCDVLLAAAEGFARWRLRQ